MRLAQEPTSASSAKIEIEVFVNLLKVFFLIHNILIAKRSLIGSQQAAIVGKFCPVLIFLKPLFTHESNN